MGFKCISLVSLGIPLEPITHYYVPLNDNVFILEHNSGYTFRAYYPLLCSNMNTLSFKGNYAHVFGINGRICPYKLVITV